MTFCLFFASERVGESLGEEGAFEHHESLPSPGQCHDRSRSGRCPRYVMKVCGACAPSKDEPSGPRPVDSPGSDDFSREVRAEPTRDRGEFDGNLFSMEDDFLRAWCGKLDGADTCLRMGSEDSGSRWLVG